ncbi:glycosyltransferase [Dyadobacter sp. MSC1_007]|jgi:UDP:flavonoid glycosyltransferase YjiC (YdhE family)|uniref:glycosyltransferase n=1 Tax=Dyadobacter sp. MSC1_007 TaxID=2909264 RepID=UPI00202FC16A|nr:nucleotide disphospho-sugar-binding domain-containing protein [Dyadobacter sp. MSC1_007]
MPKSILFLPAAIHSHIVPTFYLAKLLKELYEIHYAVVAEPLAELVSRQGHNAILTDSYRVGLGMESKFLFEKKKLSGRWNTLKSIHRNDILSYRQSELFNIIETINPAAILIDIFNSSDLLVLYSKYHQTIKLILINPMLSTYRVNGFPTVDQANWAEKNHIKDLLMSEKRAIPLKMYITRPFDLLIYKAMKRQFETLVSAGGFGEKHPLAEDRTCAMLFDHIPEIILAPVELEVSKDIRKFTQHYLGLGVDSNRVDSDIDVSFDEQFKKIRNHISAGQKLIYCTFGTFYKGSDKALLDFLNRLIDSVESIDQIQTIFSVNGLVIQTLQFQRQIPDNVHFFTRVPQLEVLKYASVYVTHGGLGSVKESVHCEVPMLVYPLDPNYDQNGNGLKIEHHGLGLRGVFQYERSSDMKKKIEDLLTNEKYKSKINRLNKICASKYSDANLKLVLNSLIDCP